MALTVHTGWSGSRGSGNLALLAGTPRCLSRDGPPWLTAVAVQSDDLARSCSQLTYRRKEEEAVMSDRDNEAEMAKEADVPLG